MRSLILILSLVATSANAAPAKNKVTTESTALDSSLAPNYGIELQLGSSRVVNGPEDATATKVTFTFAKYFNRFSVAPQISVLHIPIEGNASVSIESRSLELMLWGRYDVLRYNRFGIYSGIGLGGRRDTVETTLLGNTNSTTGDNYGIGALAIGGTWAFNPSGRFTLELHYNSAPSYEIQEFAVLVGAGAYF